MNRIPSTAATSPAPRLRQVAGALSIDEHRVGCGVGVRAEVVLVDVGEPVAGQRRSVGDHRSEPDVERMRGQQRGDRDVQVGQPGGHTGRGGEGGGEIRVPAHHLKHQLGQIHARDHAGHTGTQVFQAGRLLQGVVLAEVHPAVGVHGDVPAGGHPAGHRPPCRIQGPGMLGEQRVGLLRQQQRAQRRALHVLPRRPRQ